MAKPSPPSAATISLASRHRCEAIGGALLDQAITLVHQPGWDSDQRLLDALAADRRRDRRYRATQLGPHRADVIVLVGGRPAKDHVSRGQQKLVAAGLMLAQLEIQEQERPGRSALLLDDPAAELDGENLARLMALVRQVPAQLWVTVAQARNRRARSRRAIVPRETRRNSKRHSSTITT